MSTGTTILALLVLALVGVVPIWKHSRSWGYSPVGVVGVVFIFYSVLLFAGAI